MFTHYDTETSGLFLQGMPSDHPGQPRMLSITAVVDDASANIRHILSTLIRHQNFVIDERLTGDDGKPTAFSVNKITNEMMHDYGRPLEKVMTDICDLATTGPTLIAFNHHFDFKFLKISCAQLGDTGVTMREHLATRTAICTMESTAQHIIGKKRISLKNATWECFKRDITDAHTSFADTMASRDLFWFLKGKGALPEPKPMTERVYDTPAPEYATA